MFDIEKRKEELRRIFDVSIFIINVIDKIISQEELYDKN